MGSEWVLTVCLATMVNPCALQEEDTYADADECWEMEAEIESNIPFADAQCRLVITEEV